MSLCKPASSLSQSSRCPRSAQQPCPAPGFTSSPPDASGAAKGSSSPANNAMRDKNMTAQSLPPACGSLSRTLKQVKRAPASTVGSRRPAAERTFRGRPVDCGMHAAIHVLVYVRCLQCVWYAVHLYIASCMMKTEFVRIGRSGIHPEWRSEVWLQPGQAAAEPLAAGREQGGSLSGRPSLGAP